MYGKTISSILDLGKSTLSQKVCKNDMSFVGEVEINEVNYDLYGDNVSTSSISTIHVDNENDTSEDRK